MKAYDPRTLAKIPALRTRLAASASGYIRCAKLGVVTERHEARELYAAWIKNALTF